MKLTNILLCSLMTLSLVASEKEKEMEKLFNKTDLEILRTGGVGADAGMKVGLMTTMYIGKGLSSVAASIKATVASAGTYVASVAGSVAAAPATPYVAGGIAATWVGHKVYRSYYPTPEQREKNTEHERKSTENEEQAEHHKCKRDRSRSITAFSSCLTKNRRSLSLTSMGYPTECENDALSLSLQEDGDSEVVRMAKNFVRFGPKSRG